MRVETTPTEYVIRLDRATFSTEEVERLLRTLRLKELSSRLGGTQAEAGQLAEEVMQSWWIANQPDNKP